MYWKNQYTILFNKKQHVLWSISFFKSLFSVINNYITVVNLTRTGINVTLQELKLKTKHILQLY